MSSQSIGLGGRPRLRRGERIVGIGALAMAFGAFTGHALVPDRVADCYGWERNRLYQREIGAFNAGLGYGIIAWARGRQEEAFLGSWVTAALLLAATRFAAITSGDRSGGWNVATVIEDVALGVGGLVMLHRLRNR